MVTIGLFLAVALLVAGVAFKTTRTVSQRHAAPVSDVDELSEFLEGFVFRRRMLTCLAMVLVVTFALARLAFEGAQPGSVVASLVVYFSAFVPAAVFALGLPGGYKRHTGERLPRLSYLREVSEAGDVRAMTIGVVGAVVAAAVGLWAAGDAWFGVVSSTTMAATIGVGVIGLVTGRRADTGVFDGVGVAEFVVKRSMLAGIMFSITSTVVFAVVAEIGVVSLVPMVIMGVAAFGCLVACLMATIRLWQDDEVGAVLTR